MALTVPVRGEEQVMIESNAAEPGSEVFRNPEDQGGLFDLAFGPVAGSQPCWSLLTTRGGTVVERLVFAEPRPSRRRLRIWLTGIVGEEGARALLSRVGRFQHFYAGYYEARPDLARGHLTAVA